MFLIGTDMDWKVGNHGPNKRPTRVTMCVGLPLNRIKHGGGNARNANAAVLNLDP